MIQNLQKSIKSLSSNMEQKYSELRVLIENYIFKNEIKGYKINDFSYRSIPLKRSDFINDSDGAFKCSQYCQKDPKCEASSFKFSSSDRFVAVDRIDKV